MQIATNANVYSSKRTTQIPRTRLPAALKPNRRLKMDGLSLLERLPAGGVLLARKRQIKACQKFQGTGTEPDFVIFRRRQDRQHCHLVELKDGDAFDTKKAQGERDALHSFRARIAPDIPYTVSVHFCSFNQDDRGKIVAGYRGKIEEGEALTGREFRELLEVDYDEIVSTWLGDQPVNLRYFVGRLREIDAVRREWER